MCLGKAGGYEKHRGRSQREKKKYGFTASMRYEKASRPKHPPIGLLVQVGIDNYCATSGSVKKANPEESTCEERSVGYVRAAAALSSRKETCGFTTNMLIARAEFAFPCYPCRKKGSNLSCLCICNS